MKLHAQMEYIRNKGELESKKSLYDETWKKKKQEKKQRRRYKKDGRGAEINARKREA